MSETNLIKQIKTITIIALPLMAAFLAQKGIQITDTIMLGWLGTNQLAAGALGVAIFLTCGTFGLGTLSSVGIFVARARGQETHDEIPLILQQGIIMVFIMALPLMLLIWHLPAILLKFNQDPAVIKQVALLVHGLIWGFPGFLLFFVFREFIAAFALTRIIMLVCLFSVPLTFIGNYIFIYGKFGFPNLGIAGIGYVGAAIYWLIFMSLFSYYKLNSQLKKYIQFSSFKLDLEKILAMFRLGTPSGVILVLDAGMFSIAAVMMGSFSSAALAGHQIAIICASTVFAIAFSISMATALQVGYAAGANDFVTAKRFAWIGLSLGLIITLVIALFFIFIPGLFVKIFLNRQVSNYSTVKYYAYQLLMIAGIFQFFDTLQITLNGILKGIKDTFVPMLYYIACYWIIGLGSAYYLAFHTSLKAFGVWWGLTVGIISIAAVLFIRFLKKF